MQTSKGTIVVNEQAGKPECIYAHQPALACSAHSLKEFARSAMHGRSMTLCVSCTPRRRDACDDS